MGGMPIFRDITSVFEDEYKHAFGVLNTYFHSDFRLANLVCWGGEGSIGFMEYGENLIFKFSKYTDDSTFFAFAGASNLQQTIDYVCSMSQQMLGRIDVRLIPECYARRMKQLPNIVIDDDEEQRDYLLSIDELSELRGRKHAHTRELVHRFERDIGDEAVFFIVEDFDLLDYERLREVFFDREFKKNNTDYQKELRAMGRMVQYARNLDVECGLVTIKGKIQAFIFFETIDSSSVLAHYWRANTEYRGLYQFMLNRLCAVLHRRGHVELNFMQDLGIEGLRKAKEYLRPTGYKKKYVVRKWAPSQKQKPHIAAYRQAFEAQLLAVPY